MSESNPDRNAAHDLSREDFLAVLRATPLVSIDIAMYDGEGKALLGRRTFRPARGAWFVPGGRIRKGETVADAFGRICARELGIEARLDDARLLGVFDHLYDDNRFGVDGITTHYVAIGYAYRLPGNARVRADDQHDELRWFAIDELLRHPDVHENTKRYFRERD